MTMTFASPVTSTDNDIGDLIDRVIPAKVEKMYRQKAERQKAVSNTYVNYGHGPGLFTEPMMPDIMNAMQLPLQGFEAFLVNEGLELGVDFERPLYGIITGQTEISGQAAATGPCTTWGLAGFTKLCRQDAVLGTKGGQSQPIDLTRLGRFSNRADFRDYNLIGDPFMNTYTGSNPSDNLVGLGGKNDFLRNETAKIMREMYVDMTRRFAPDVWTANPASAADAYHTAFERGFQYLVNTGYRDAINGLACAKADPTIYNFNSADISASATNGGILVQVMSEIIWKLQYQRREMGFTDVKWVWVMTPTAFREVTAIWPCSYLTNRCLTASSSSPNMVIATEQVAMREEMRSGQFLWVDAQKMPVIVDSTLPETQTAGSAFTSDIFLMPIYVNGRYPVTLKTYFDFRSQYAAGDAIQELGNLLYGSAVSPDGKFLYASDKSYNCFQVQATTRQGYVLRTPYLAARITNIKYSVRSILDSWNPGNASFWKDGGEITGSGPSYFTPR